MIRALLAVAVATTLAGHAHAATDPRLAARLDAATAGEVQAIVDQAAAERLPTAPLISKALEGAAKRASAERIVTAVRAQKAAMVDARAALGDTASANEVVAGAGALLAGAPADSLTRLRAIRPGQPLVVPLVVLADLVARNVPPAAASEAVLTAARAHARDQALLDLRKSIERDIAGGAAPADAAILRARGLRPAPNAAPDAKRGRHLGDPR